MKRLVIFWGIENVEQDFVNVTLHRNDNDYVVFASGDEIDINLFVGDDIERYDFTYSEATRRRSRQILEDFLNSDDDANSDTDTSVDTDSQN